MKTLDRIMLIDDDPDTNLYNKIVLEQIKASNEIVIFQNGKDALKFLEQKNDNVDLILLDINMPIMNGWQFLENYEKLEKEKQTAVVVVMLTSSANRDDRKKAETFDSVKKYINKPLDTSTIEDILALFD